MALNGSMRARRAAGRSINATMMAPPATGRKSRQIPRRLRGVIPQPR
jgi:hypothetical protein